MSVDEPKDNSFRGIIIIAFWLSYVLGLMGFIGSLLANKKIDRFMEKITYSTVKYDGDFLQYVQSGNKAYFVVLKDDEISIREDK